MCVWAWLERVGVQAEGRTGWGRGFGKEGLGISGSLGGGQKGASGAHLPPAALSYDHFNCVLWGLVLSFKCEGRRQNCRLTSRSLVGTSTAPSIGTPGGALMEAVDRTSLCSTCGGVLQSSTVTKLPGGIFLRMGSRLTIHPPVLPAEASWGAWGPWGPCSGSCGPGRRLRRRRCSSSAGNTCPGRPLEAQKCVRPRCPGRRGGAS